MLCSPSRELPGPVGQQGGYTLQLSHSHLVPRTITIGAMYLARVTLLSALAGKNLVPEQALQVQEADEAGWGGSGGERAGQRPGTVCRLPTRASRLEPQLLIREGLRRQRRLLHPQLHIVVPLGAPRSYAATPADVRLPTRTRQRPSCFPWLERLRPPGPSTPSACPGPGERPRGKEEGTVKAGLPPHPPRSPAWSQPVTSPAPTPSPEPRPEPRGERAESGLGAQAQPPETAVATRRAR